jgi:hypothetical protein
MCSDVKKQQKKSRVAKPRGMLSGGFSTLVTRLQAPQLAGVPEGTSSS